MLSSSKNGKSRGLQQPGTVPILLLNTSPHSQPLWPLSNEGSLGRDGLNWYYKLSTNEFCSAGLDKLWSWLATMFSFCRLAACKRHYCNKKQFISMFRICGSLWLSLALSLAHCHCHCDSGSLWRAWLFPAHFRSPSCSLRRSSAHKVLDQLSRSWTRGHSFFGLL